MQKEAKEALGRLSYKQAVLQQEKDTLASQVSDLGTQLYRANEALATWERAGAESLTMADRNSALQQENTTLRAEVKRLQPPSANADALVRVMINRVKSLHWLAIYQIQRGVEITGQHLPSYDNEQILAAAQRQAFVARRDYYLSIRGPYQPKPVWVREDYLLDAESEKKVCDDASFKNRLLISELEDQRRRVEMKI